ncbi:MAG TPA: hypothetical protein PKD00_05875 [Burkholderiales bacterium]|nr:hypothetical protein [Burkholderiales bacterium]
MNNIKNLINNPNIICENKENNSFAINSPKKLSFFNDDLKPFPEVQELSETKPKKVDSSKKLKPKEILKCKDESITKFSTPIQDKTQKSNCLIEKGNKLFTPQVNAKKISTYLKFPKVVLRYDVRPNNPYKMDQTHKFTITFHHVIDFRSIGGIFNDVFGSSKISDEEKFYLGTLIYLKLMSNKEILKNEVKSISETCSIDEIFNSLKKLTIFSEPDNSLNSDDISNLNEIFLYFYSIGFIGSDEQHRVEELKAKQGFDGIGRYFLDSEHYKKLKRLSEKNIDEREKYILLVELSKIKPNLSFNKDKYSIIEIKGMSYEYPKVLENEINTYMKHMELLSKVEKDIREGTKNLDNKYKKDIKMVKNALNQLKLKNKDNEKLLKLKDDEKLKSLIEKMEEEKILKDKLGEINKHVQKTPNSMETKNKKDLGIVYKK